MADEVSTGNFVPHERTSRSLSLWMPRLKHADLEYSRSRDIATGRARELVVDSAYGKNAVRIHKDNVVGPSFRLALRPMFELLEISIEQADDWARLVEQQWEAYANAPTFDCDAQRVCTFPALMQMAYQGLLTAGESFHLLKWKPGLGTGYNTCMLAIEPERVSQPSSAPETRLFRHGIECDVDGAPIAYHIKRAHDTEHQFTDDMLKWDRVTRFTPWGRYQVLHMIDRHRPDLRRGLSQFSAAIKQMKLIEEYDRAEVESAILQASFAAVIKTELPNFEAMALLGAVSGMDKLKSRTASDAMAYMEGVSPWHRELDIKLNGARAVNLLPGETLEFPKPQNNGVNFEAFQDAAVRKIAAAVGTSAEQLSRDFRQMTFASAKLSLGDVWRHFVVNRELCIRQVGLPFVSAWLEEAIDSQRLPLPNGKTGGIADYMAVRAAIFAKSTFVSWGPPMVEPVKEREGQKLALGLGLTTLQTEAQNDGLDWEEIAIQRNRERKLQEKLDLPLPEELEKSAAPPGEEDGPPGAPAKKKPA